MMDNVLFMAVIILLINIVYVTINMSLTLKGYWYTAACESMSIHGGSWIKHVRKGKIMR